LVNDIANGTAVVVCDGSYFEIHGIGSSAWILSSADGLSWIEGGGIVPGPISDLNSYRCELGRLLGIGIGIACLKNLLPARRHFMLTACDNLEALRKITVRRHFMLTACDNLEALRKITVARTKVKTSWKSVDFISQILDVWSQQHCQPSPQHVYGHQDDKGMAPLTLVECLNVCMDKVAKTLAIRSFGRTPAIPTAVPLIGLGQVVIQGSLVASTFQKSLTRNSHHNEMVEYLAHKWDIDTDILHDSVAWSSIVKAHKRASFPFQRFISKWISEDIALLCIVESKEYTTSALDVMRRMNILSIF